MSTYSGDGDYCNTIVANQNVSGPGIRAAVYTQTILCMLAATWLSGHERAVRDICRNCYIVSLGLIVNAIIFWKTSGLSLYDGLIVTMLTTMMTSFATVNTRYLRTLGLSITLSSFLFYAFWCYWGLQIWSDPWKFGLPPGRDCTANRDTVFVVFGRSVGAASRGLRGFAIFIFALGCISAVSALVHTVVWLYWYISGTAADAKYRAALKYAKELQKSSEKKKKDRSTTRIHPIARYGGIGSIIYIIVTTEQMIARNPSVRADRNVWSFGQTFAFVILGQQIMDIFGYIQEYALYLKTVRQYREDTEANHEDPRGTKKPKDREEPDRSRDFEGSNEHPQGNHTSTDDSGRP